MSLRSRLLLGTLTLVLVALGAFGLATVMLLRSYLLDRIDPQPETHPIARRPS